MTFTITLFDFQDRGACRDHDPELFFPVSESGPVGEQQVAHAKAVCHLECPVIEECRAFALVNSVDGIWGGMSEAERRALRAQDSATASAGEDGELDGVEQEPGENDQPELMPALPSYTSARQSLMRARRALDVAEQSEDADAVSRAEQRLARAQQQFAAVRAQTTSGAVA